MRVDLQFPYSNQWESKLTSLIEKATIFELDWYWQPFHQAGFESLTWAAEQGWERNLVDSAIAQISCPSVSGSQKEEFLRTRLCDENGRVWPLDPESSIRKTWELSGHLTNWANRALPTIEDLRQLLQTSWIPDLKSSVEFSQVSTWLTGEPFLLKKFQRLSAWDQLICLETLSGCAFPKSTLTFQRIYTVST
ncbi:MAG: hypothetical protein IT289_08465 [Oligoflexia bacterium]|nr:hypothetical protein [Oligoflexia bacterium]